MERLKESAPVAKLSTAQKKQLAELDSRYAARIAERELALKDDAAKAAAAGEFERIGQLQQQLSNERNAIRAELEDKKNRIRAGAKA
jgi:hypothetical protein